MNKYYQILGLEEGASNKEIQEAYDKLSVELDPKNNDNLDFFKEEFALLQDAYEKLMGHAPDSILKNIPKYNDSSDEIIETPNLNPKFSNMLLADSLVLNLVLSS